MRLHILGDSTAANKLYSAYPERGWGQEIFAFLNEQIQVMNYATNGRSTKSFIDEGRFDNALSNMQEGDFVIIQFGHNDQKVDSPERYSNHEDYYKNLEFMINETRKKGATPILLTSIYRRAFDNGVIRENSHKGYPEVMIKCANANNVHCIDMTSITRNWLEELGDKASKKYFLISEHPIKNYPNGVLDNTHLCVEGAYEVASMIIQELKKSPLEIKSYIIA